MQHKDDDITAAAQMHGAHRSITHTLAPHATRSASLTIEMVSGTGSAAQAGSQNKSWETAVMCNDIKML